MQNNNNDRLHIVLKIDQENQNYSLGKLAKNMNRQFPGDKMEING